MASNPSKTSDEGDAYADIDKHVVKAPARLKGFLSVDKLLEAAQQQQRQDDETDEVFERMDELEAFINLEQKIFEKAERGKLTEAMRAIGGSSTSEMIRRVMRHYGSSQLWCQFSGQGRSGKKKMVEQKFYFCLGRAVQSTVTPTPNEKAIQRQVGVFLAQEGHGARKKKEETSRFEQSDSDEA